MERLAQEKHIPLARGIGRISGHRLISQHARHEQDLAVPSIRHFLAKDVCQFR